VGHVRTLGWDPCSIRTFRKDFVLGHFTHFEHYSAPREAQANPDNKICTSLKNPKVFGA